MAESSSVQSLDRAFDLLELLCKSRNGMSIGALSAETGLHKSTVHRLLSSMCTRGYVQRDAVTSIYRAGMRLCELSSFIMDNLDVVERARLPMERLSRETEETVHLVMQEEHDIVYIHKVESDRGAIRMFSRIGMRRPLYCTGVGKAILATWPDSEVHALWQESDVKPWTAHTDLCPRMPFSMSWSECADWAMRSMMRKTSWVCAALPLRFRTIAAVRPMQFRFPRQSAACRMSASACCAVRCWQHAMR